MLSQQSIINFCNANNYDIKKSGNGRWIDQKCAADVVTVIADCIYNYVIDNPGISFTSNDIWHYQYAIDNVTSIFKKPHVENNNAKSEYDKFFQQPMEMLANANVLIKKKEKTRNVYTVANIDILEYIALRERNALFFLKTYIEKVLTDSGIMYLFENFFKNPNKQSYELLKDGYCNFIIKNTKINGKTECNRIFIKVLNPLSYFRNTYGTLRGHISNQVITYDMLMYNRNNFRDIYADKPKGVTRKEYAATHPAEVNEAYYHYQSSKAKRFLRLFNDQNRNGETEHIDGVHIKDKAIHMHHIFPESSYPEICFYLENIIALTPTQHLNYAHPNGHTQEINIQYQHMLLLSKADRIKENLTNAVLEKIYTFSNLLFVLTVGFDNDSISEIDDMDFCSLINAINVHYGDLSLC